MRADTTGLLEAVTAGLGSGGAALADSIAQRAGKGKGARRAQSALTRAKGVQKMGQPGQIRGKGAVLGVHGACAGRASDGPKGRKNTRSQFYISAKIRKSCRIATAARVSGIGQLPTGPFFNSTKNDLQLNGNGEKKQAGAPEEQTPEGGPLPCSGGVRGACGRRARGRQKWPQAK